MSSVPEHEKRCTRYTVIWYSLAMTCGESEFIITNDTSWHDIDEILSEENVHQTTKTCFQSKTQSFQWCQFLRTFCLKVFFFLPKKCLFLKQDIYLKQSWIYHFTLHWEIFVQRACSLCSNDNTAAHMTYHQSSTTGDSSRTWTAYLFFAFKPLYFSSLL